MLSMRIGLLVRPVQAGLGRLGWNLRHRGLSDKAGLPDGTELLAFRAGPARVQQAVMGTFGLVIAGLCVPVNGSSVGFEYQHPETAEERLEKIDPLLKAGELWEALKLLPAIDVTGRTVVVVVLAWIMYRIGKFNERTVRSLKLVLGEPNKLRVELLKFWGRGTESLDVAVRDLPGSMAQLEPEFLNSPMWILHKGAVNDRLYLFRQGAEHWDWDLMKMAVQNPNELNHQLNDLRAAKPADQIPKGRALGERLTF